MNAWIWAQLLAGSLLLACVAGTIAHHRDVKAARVLADIARVEDGLGVTEIRPRSHRYPRRQRWARLLSVGATARGFGGALEADRHLVAAEFRSLVARSWTDAELAELGELVT